ncbi:3-phosphoshikimate 1-carboxyvinyltransferase [Weissella viridescens]|uniref:chorismate synthase n=1 Tax=Weissella viridescens TaxID=1629 RepID=A0A380P3N3_WEIVI|nr:3-phosphoshikimate 1-carboxyvinyltransferase [Weissella viridescens]
MTTGEPIVVKGVVKPIPTLYRPMESVNIATHETDRASIERSDTTAVPTAAVIAEAMVAITLAQAMLDKFDADQLVRFKAQVDQYRTELKEFRMTQQQLPSKRSHLKGMIQVPGDKSISHRAIMLGSMARGTSKVRHLLMADDVQSTMQVYRQLGVTIETSGEDTVIVSPGVAHLRAPDQPLDFGNSGTTLRLSLGVLAKQPFHIDMIGDVSLQNGLWDGF